uniref:Ribosomal protein L2 C-terminal domain-containing protein n=1 Tax=Setaria digitata TaxID=48799 RepID=A0A915PJN9_9BILA
MSITNDIPDNGPRSSTVGITSASISEEEFYRLQEQLLELRNRNYELLEENRRQQNYINSLPSKGAEALLFASKLVGRKKDKDNSNEKLENEVRLLQQKLSSQEEEFRLQQSTLLSELNKVAKGTTEMEMKVKGQKKHGDYQHQCHFSNILQVVKQCELLEVKAKENGENIDNNYLAERNKSDMKELMKTNSDLQMEVSLLKEVLTKKDLLIAQLKTSSEEVLSSKEVLIEEISIERQRSANLQSELQEALKLCTINKEMLKEKDEAIKALQSFYEKEKVNTTDKQSQTDNLGDIDELKEYARNLEVECERLRMIEDDVSKKTALLKEGQKLQNILEMELQTAKTEIIAEKEKNIAEEAAWEEMKQGFATEIQALSMQVLELQRSKEEEQASAAQNFELIKVALETKIKEDEEEIRRKDEEMTVALKKQSSMVKELRRQVQSEKKRAEQAEKHLDDVLGMGDANVYAHNSSRIRIGGSPSTLSDRFKVKGDGESSICSWAFVAEPDRNSCQNFDEESSCSASILEADNAELISRLAVLQKKHAETLDRLNMIEEENTLLRKEVNEKSEVIAEWIRTIPDTNHNSQIANTSPGLRFRRMLEIVRVDESAADIRDMNRRLQRMLEETLSKNLVLQKLICRGGILMGKFMVASYTNWGKLLSEKPLLVLTMFAFSIHVVETLILNQIMFLVSVAVWWGSFALTIEAGDKLLRLVENSDFSLKQNIWHGIRKLLDGLVKLDSEAEVASTVPGGTNIPETNEELDVDLDKTAAGLRTADDGTYEENRCDDEALLSELSRREFTVFVLSEVGKPIFASCGHEEQLCSLIALIQTFVMVVTSWNDSLKRIRSAQMQISFSYRSPLILCIVSRDGFQLDAQVDLVYKQMLSIICRAQLISIFQAKGPNFDLRFMLKGTDRHLNAIVSGCRNDIAVFMRSIRIFPMAFADREQFTSAIVSAVKNVVYGLVVANRQLITVVRMKGIPLNPCDLHLLINLIDCNPSLKNADNWIPICLPQFNDTGFLYAYVSFIWEGSDACLLLLSLERGAFETLRGVKEMIVTRLHSSKSRASLKNAVENPSSFDVETNFPSDLWHFTYKNRCSSQVCCSQHSVPFISKDERCKLQEYYKKLFGYSVRIPNLKHLFITRPECCLLSNVTSNYELHCVLSPFVTRAAASAHADRLLKMLKKEESKYFPCKMQAGLLSTLRCFHLSPFALSIITKRFIPARGSKPLPRYLWDMEDLKKKAKGGYTHEPLVLHRLGGRDPKTGRKVNQHIGGGVKFDYFMIDFHRRGPKEPDATYDERVLVIEVRRDPNRTCLIALVAGWEGKRWILATENMIAGQIISTTCYIPESPQEGKEGNAYPLGALAPGSLVNSVEKFPNERKYPSTDDDVFIVTAGTCAEIVRHQGDFVVIRAIGRLSNAEFHNKIFGSAQMHRRFGYKMSSGLFHKKDGYLGRKVRRLPPPRTLKPEEPPRELQSFTLTKEQQSGLTGIHRMPQMAHAGFNYREYPD